MKSELLSYFPFIGLVGTGLILFLTVFIGTVIWTFRAGSSKLYDNLEKLPIEGDYNVR